MLTVNCICVGKLKERYWTQACEEYQKRLGAFCKFRIMEVAEYKLPEQPSETQIQQALKAEGEKILQLAAGSTLIPLCIEGKQIDSPALAQHLGTLALNGVSAVSFVIGSSHGLCDKVKQSGTLAAFHVTYDVSASIGKGNALRANLPCISDTKSWPLP